MGAVDANPYFRDAVFEKAHHMRPKDKPRVKRSDDSEPLYIHLIAHTHDDVGWLKTVDEYYAGSMEKTFQQAEVNLIISDTVANVMENKERKFTYVEMKFFSMWWDRASEK